MAFFIILECGGKSSSTTLLSGYQLPVTTNLTNRELSTGYH